MKKYVITEEQYNMALKEGVTLKADVSAAGGDVKKAIENTKQQAQRSGINMNDVTISINGSDTNEGRVIKKHELEENRLRALKKHSDVYKTSDFLNKIVKS